MTYPTSPAGHHGFIEFTGTGRHSRSTWNTVFITCYFEKLAAKKLEGVPPAYKNRCDIWSTGNTRPHACKRNPISLNLDFGSRSITWLSAYTATFYTHSTLGPACKGNRVAQWEVAQRNLIQTGNERFALKSMHSDFQLFECDEWCLKQNTSYMDTVIQRQ